MGSELTPSSLTLAQARKLRRRRGTPFAGMRPRRILLGFLGIVVFPFSLCTAYLGLVAQPQFYAVAGFTTRSSQPSLAPETLAAGLVFSASSPVSENDILFSYLRSQDLVARVDRALNLKEHYSENFLSDPVFLLRSTASIEDLHRYWNRIFEVNFDRTSGLIEMRLRARDAQFAQAVLNEVITASDEKINDINVSAYQDAVRFAQSTLRDAKSEWGEKRAAMQAFRKDHGIVDPTIEIESRMGVLASMQQELANALIDFDELRQTTSEGDPRLRKLGDRVTVIRARLATERAEFYGADGLQGLNFPELVSSFEALSADLEFAELSYTAALAALEAARADAIKKSRYLAVYLPPSRAETSEFPRILETLAICAFFCLLIWLVLTILHLSVRERR